MEKYQSTEHAAIKHVIGPSEGDLIWLAKDGYFDICVFSLHFLTTIGAVGDHLSVSFNFDAVSLPIAKRFVVRKRYSQVEFSIFVFVIKIDFLFFFFQRNFEKVICVSTSHDN